MTSPCHQLRQGYTDAPWSAFLPPDASLSLQEAKRLVRRHRPAVGRRAERRAEVIVCVPMWSNRDWYHALIDLDDDKMKVQAGKLQRIAEDAPKRLEEWPVVIFRVPMRAAKAPSVE